MKSVYTKAIKNKTILVTGGTGSFGHQVVSTLLSCSPKRIIIFSRDETKQFDMRNLYNDPLLKFVIGDVRDKENLDKVMDGVDYVFHAAALKQVPTSEFFPMEAVKTNILGTNNVVSSAIEHGVKKVVALSTDKAVYPINAMGMTKALMEKIIIAESKNISDSNSHTILCCVRYGNVLYTRGSVLPYFVSKIKENEKLPVTNPYMTRFLLPLSDAVDLVLFALAKGENGSIYVRKSAASTIETLAKAVCKIFNYRKGYNEVGIRAGEKIHETLVTEEELLRAKDLGSYYQIIPESQGKKADPKTVAFTSQNTKRLDLKAAIKLLQEVPEIRKEIKLMQNLSTLPKLP